jgi:cyclin H
MTYEGQNISRTAMFIANKAESYFLNAENYAARFGPKATAEKVLAPEYLIIQALRYNLDVRHPFRGLKGGHLELVELAHGSLASLPNATESPPELQKRMLLLPRKTGGPEAKMTAAELEQRILNAYGFASNVLKTAALLTDAYFLYSPSHIWLASHLLADEPLTLFYLSTKLPPTNPMYTKTLNTLRACATLLSSHKSFIPANAPPVDKAEKETRERKDREEIARLVKKLKQCRDPDKIDLVKLNQAQKRDAVTEDGLEENKAKRRKLKRDGFEKEAEGFWGPELPKGGGEGN